MAADQLHERVDTVRQFNRFYTKRIGLLNRGLLKTRFPLTQARILFELAQHQQETASDLISELGIDPGYLSRILSNFEKVGLLRRRQSKSDSRRRLLKLTAKGKKIFSTLNKRSRQEMETLLRNISAEDQDRLLHSMHTIENILEAENQGSMTYVLRPHKPGDIGWMIHRHGVLYSQEYGFDETFDALVADILAKFILKHDPKRERIWIAEQDGDSIGSVMVVNAGKQTAQLRLLLVEPKTRGNGVGKRLIDECIDFSRRTGYKKIKLWTQNNLLEARHLYIKAGFEVVEEKPHYSFGHDLVAEIWERTLY